MVQVKKSFLNFIPVLGFSFIYSSGVFSDVVEPLSRVESEARKTLYFQPISDSWVRRGSDEVFGDEFRVHVGGNKNITSDKYFGDGVLKFSLSDLPENSKIIKASLSLDIYLSLLTSEAELYSIGNDWNENTISGDTSIHRTQYLGKWESQDLTKGIATIDITSLVKSKRTGELSFLLTNENSFNEEYKNNSFNFYTKEREAGGQSPATIAVEYFVEDTGPTPDIYRRYLAHDYTNKYSLNDWTTAGYKGGRELGQENITNRPIFNVKDFGAKPDDGNDDLDAVQRAINEASMLPEGGIVKFESGVYDFNVDSGKWRSIEIKHSNIVLRGMGGNGELATVLRQHNAVDDTQLNEVRTPHFLTVAGEMTEPNRSSPLVGSTSIGDNRIIVKEHQDINFKAGDRFILSNFNRNGSEAATLEAVYPLKKESETWHFSRYTAISHANIIKSVNHTENGVELSLVSRLPYSFSERFFADIRLQNHSLKNVGIESLKILMKVKDGYEYSHHKSPAYNYANAGISFSNVTDSWIQDVVIENFTLDISMHESMFNTVKNITLTGVDGHHGVGVYHNSFNNLFDGVTQLANRTHGVSFNSNSSGNVIRNLINPSMKNSANIDFHGGGLPSFNLIENSNNITINSSGALANLPHSGPYNTFWNVVTRGDEVHSRSGYSYSGTDVSWETDHFDHYRLHPKTVVVGAYSPYFLSTVARKSNNQLESDWFYVERLNKGEVIPKSLYEAQKRRLK